MTRSLIVIRNAAGDILQIIYIGHDGYESGIGIDLARTLLTDEAEGFGSMVAACGATLVLEQSYHEDKPVIDYHSLLRCDEKTIAEMRGEPPMGYEAGVMMDYVFTVREGAAGGSPEIAVTRCGEASPGAPLTPSAFIEEHADQPNSEDAPGAPWSLHAAFLADYHAKPLPSFAPAPGGVALRVSSDDRGDYLCLLLQGDGWGDYLADALPALIRRGVEGFDRFATECLVDLKRGPGRVFATTAALLPPGVPVVLVHLQEERRSTPNVQVSVRRGTTTIFAAAMAIGYTREGEGLDMRIFPPPADDMMDTMQPALDQLADHLRSSWTPSKHEHFPLAVKERAVQLLLIGHALSASVGAGLKDVWLSHLMPHALAHVRVIRPKALIEDVSGESEDSEEEDLPAQTVQVLAQQAQHMNN